MIHKKFLDMDIGWSEMKDAVAKNCGMTHTEISRMDVGKFFIKIESINKKNG
jgi:hypothetical protein